MGYEAVPPTALPCKLLTRHKPPLTNANIRSEWEGLIGMASIIALAVPLKYRLFKTHLPLPKRFVWD